jgi:hypothetical protein
MLSANAPAGGEEGGDTQGPGGEGVVVVVVMVMVVVVCED